MSIESNVNRGENKRENEPNELYLWTLRHCSNSSISTTPDTTRGREIFFEEGWRMIEIHGLNVLKDMLKECITTATGDFKKIQNPFGTNGVVSLYTISYKISNSTPPPFSEAQEFYFR